MTFTLKELLYIVVLICAANSLPPGSNSASGIVKSLRLNDGNEIPVLGLGTSVRGGDLDDMQKAIEAAIGDGYRHIDTAVYYNTEKRVGLGVKNKINDGTVKRDDVFITTKLTNNDHRFEQVVPALRRSLENLGMDYVDLYLVHSPMAQDEYGNFTNTHFLETWKGMEEAHGLGLTKSIGVSNFNETQIQQILDACKVKPVVNQVEVNPNNVQKKLVSFCKDKDIQVVAYCPLGSMAEKRFPNGTHTSNRDPHLDDPILTAIGTKYNKTTVQVVLRYLIDRDLVTIPKSVTPSRIRQNIDIFNFKLNPEEIAKIDDFNQDYRIFTLLEWSSSPYYPF